MNENQDYQQDLASIRSLMERSVKFISLSGRSGILAGIYALAGAVFAYYIIYRGDTVLPVDYREHPQLIYQLGLVAVAVLIASLATGWYLSAGKARAQGTTIWNETSKRLFVNLAIPLVSGGIFIIILTVRGYFGMIAPCLLLFYGLALVNASANLYDEFRYLGYAEIVLALIATVFPGYGLLFWTIGFGVLHVFYGALMSRKYDR